MLKMSEKMLGDDIRVRYACHRLSIDYTSYSMLTR